MLRAVDGELYPQHEVAVDADRTPRDPQEVAGAAKLDPWEEDPRRWEGTEPITPAGAREDGDG